MCSFINRLAVAGGVSRGRREPEYIMRAHPKTAFASGLIAVLIVGNLAAQTRELGGSGELLDGIAAIVNDGIVLKSQLVLQVNTVKERLRANGTAMPLSDRDLQLRILDQLIVTEIQLQRAARLDMQVPDGALNQALSEVAARNNMTLSELPDALASQGIDYTEYREEMRKQMLVEQLRSRDVISRIVVSPRELEDFLVEQDNSAADAVDYDVSHILIGLPSGATPEQISEAEQRAAGVHRQLNAGEGFASLAVAYSDAQDALEGGHLGWRKGSQLPTVFSPVVAGIQPGEFSAPLRSASGYHIVMVNETRGTERVIVNQNHVRHILLSPNAILDTAAVRQKLVQIKVQLDEGTDFAEIARAVSEDKSSGSDGGDLGWNSPGSFVPVFEEVCDSLEIGEISEPFETRFGWHIVQIVDRRVHDATDEVKRQQAIIAIRGRKLEEETELWVRELRTEAYVDYRI